MPQQPLHVVWASDTGVLHGFDIASGSWLDSPISLGVIFPGTTTTPVVIYLTSSGMRRQSYDILTGVQIFLKAQPPAGVTFQVSFDEAKTFQDLTDTPLLIPAGAISSDTPADGVIGPFDSATLLFRAVVDPSFSDYQSIDLRLGTLCDVI